jgi:ribosomal protein S18 acetylase RimI-like enzyme
MPVKFGLVLEFLEDVVSSVNILGDYGVDRYLELFMLSTHSTKRCPGLGTELVRQTLLVGKQKGFPLCVTEATSFFSQKIFTRLGFHVIKEVKYEDYKPHGKVVFPAQGMHDTLKLMAKRID